LAQVKIEQNFTPSAKPWVTTLSDFIFPQHAFLKMVHVYDETRKTFVQTHYSNLKQRPTTQVRKRMQGMEYVKYLQECEKKCKRSTPDMKQDE